MEGTPYGDTSERLSVFLDRVVAFLRATARTPSLGTEVERVQLAEALEELAELQLPRAKQQLREQRESEGFEAVGFSPRQTEFKLRAAERAMSEAIEPTTTGWMAPTAIWRAVGKVRVILASIKSLSKWLEALDELVGMTGELAKNRLGTKQE